MQIDRMENYFCDITENVLIIKYHTDTQLFLTQSAEGAQIAYSCSSQPEGEGRRMPGGKRAGAGG
jgi:hypothetical protein